VLETPGSSPIALIGAALVVSVLGSLFAAGDGALVALPEARLQVLREESGPDGQHFKRYSNDRQRVLSRWLVCRVVATSLAAVLYARAGDRFFGSTYLAFLFAVLAAVLTYGLFAELLLTLGRRRPEPMAIFALRYLQPLEWAVVPLAEPLARLGRAFGRRFAPRRPIDARFTETEVEWVVTQGEKSGTIANEPAEMIRNVLEFKELTAREVMVPRRRISGIEVSTSLEQVVGMVASEGHSRYPVYRETLDNIVGLLYAKDLFAIMKEKKVHATKLNELTRAPVLFVVETQPILSILREMRARRLHMAIVSDEYGGTSGVITMEDVIEEIVGEIEDEYDTDAEMQIQDIGDGRMVADAAVALTDLAERLGMEFPVNGEFESLGGLIVHRAGRVPEVGATVTLDGLKFIVREADETRVVKVEIVPIEKAKPPPAVASAL
jgi:putative hemolysin